MSEYITDNIDIFSGDSDEENSDKGISNEENSNKENSDEKNFMKKFKYETER